MTEMSMVLHCILFFVSITVLPFMLLQPWAWTVIRYNDVHKFMQSNYKAVFYFTQEEMKTAEKYSVMLPKHVIPICFTDENEKALSNVVCMQISETENMSMDSFECAVSFLPLSEIKFSFDKYIKLNFTFFCNNKKAGTGIIYCEKLDRWVS